MKITENKLMIYLLISIPVFSLIINGISWLCFGIDLPLWDDWRNYSSGNMGSLDLAYLFKSANDTLFPVGQVLDSLAFRYLDGNTIAYQIISMLTVLGLLLLLQWNLLSSALNNRLLAASAFSLTILMLQPDTYWGWTNLAYHQALPLIFCLASIKIVVRQNGLRWWDVPVLLIFGTLSGFSYISGAFAILIVGIVLITISKFIDHRDRKSVLYGGTTLTIAGIFTTLAQIWVIVSVQNGTSRADAPMAFPVDGNFWLYMLGKIARSLMLPIQNPVFSLTFVSFISAIVTFFIFRAIRSLIKYKTKPLSDVKLPLIYISIFSFIMVYLGLVSAGRTNLHPSEINTSMQIFTFGFYRFHFFWVTLLWPWFAAMVFTFVKSLDPTRAINLQRNIALMTPVVVLPLLVYAGALNHYEFYRYTMERRVAGLKCMMQSLQTEENFNCPEVDINPIRKGFYYGKNSGASFARLVPYLPFPIGAKPENQIFRMSPENLQNFVIKNANVVGLVQDGLEIQTFKDPMIFIRTGNAKKMEKCSTLEVGVSLNTPVPDILKIFFKSFGQNGFTEIASSAIQINAEKVSKEFFFVLESKSGFEDELRFDPATKAQQLYLKDFEVRCKRSEILNDRSDDENFSHFFHENKPSFILQKSFPIKFLMSDAHKNGNEYLSRIGILIGTYDKRNVGSAELRLSTDNGTVFTTRFSVETLNNNKYRYFDIDPKHYVTGEISSITGVGISTYEAHYKNNRINTCLIYEYNNGKRRFTEGCPRS